MIDLLRNRAFKVFLAALGSFATICYSSNAQSANPVASEQGMLCRNAVRQAEVGSAMPPHLLAGIARVESGRRDPVSGRLHPWPWSINSQGRDSIFETKAEAIVFARQLQAQGIRSFDVGCLQVNLMYHPDAFQSLEEAFDPVTNARYAVKFLTKLREQSGSWETASAWYHSANPAEGNPYRGKVVIAMVEEAKLTTAEPEQAEAARPTLSSGGYPVRSMMGRTANVMMLTGSSGGNVMAQTTVPGASAPPGRGLEAYRLQPVAFMGRRMAAR